MTAAKASEEESLRRLGGGRWQTRDERFTIEPQSGTWAIVDAEQTDDLGLPLVRGPYPSLTAAKSAIAEARGSAAPSSPLKGRPKPGRWASAAPTTSPSSETTKRASKPKEPEEPAEPEEPRWFRDLTPDDRRRASRLIERLAKAGADAGQLDPSRLREAVEQAARPRVARRRADHLRTVRERLEHGGDRREARGERDRLAASQRADRRLERRPARRAFLTRVAGVVEVRRGHERRVQRPARHPCRPSRMDRDVLWPHCRGP